MLRDMLIIVPVTYVQKQKQRLDLMVARNIGDNPIISKVTMLTLTNTVIFRY